MTNYLQKTLKYLGKEGSEVLAHSISVDGQAYVVVLAPGPKHRVPLSELEAMKEAEEAVVEKHPLYDLSYRELQAMAKQFDIPANQSTDDLVAALLSLEADLEEGEEE